MATNFPSPYGAPAANATYDWPGRELGLTASGPGALASLGQRLGARAIDVSAWVAVAIVLAMVESGVQATAALPGNAVT